MKNANVFDSVSPWNFQVIVKLGNCYRLFCNFMTYAFCQVFHRDTITFIDFDNLTYWCNHFHWEIKVKSPSRLRTLASSAVFWRNFSPFKIIKNFNLQNCLDFSKKLTPTPLATIFVLLSFCQFVLVSYSVTATGGPAIHCLQKFKKIPQNSTFHNIKKLVKFWLLFT